MAKLLVPIDESENAAVAAQYAAQIAENFNYDLILFHVFRSHDNQYGAINKMEDPLESEDREHVLETESTLRNLYPNVNISSQFENGILTDAIEKIALREEIEAIVMGTKGSSGLDSVLLGSNTYDVIKEAQLPVLAIPVNAKKVKSNNVVILTNFKDGEIEVLLEAKKLFNTDEMHLTLLHINNNNTPIKELDQQFKIWIDKIIIATGISDISYITKEPAYFAGSKQNIGNTINTLLSDIDVDLVLITKSRKSFFQTLFTENIIKKMAFEITIPNLFGSKKNS